MKQAHIRLFLLLLAGILPAAVPAWVSAHGSGVLQLEGVPAGPYLVTAWLSPAEPIAGEAIHVTVGVQLPGDSGSEFVLDADITLQVNAADQSEPVLVSQATTEQSVNKLLYESDMVLDQGGRYTVMVQISGDAGAGQTSFDLDLQPAAPDGISTAIVEVAFGLLLGAALALFLWRRRTYR